MDFLQGAMNRRVILLGLLAWSRLDLARAGVSLDPVNNFCRRIGHSCWSLRNLFRPLHTDNVTAVLKNGTLYINGGIETFVDFGADGQQDTSTITSGISRCKDRSDR